MINKEFLRILKQQNDIRKYWNCMYSNSTYVDNQKNICQLGGHKLRAVKTN